MPPKGGGDSAGRVRLHHRRVPTRTDEGGGWDSEGGFQQRIILEGRDIQDTSRREGGKEMGEIKNTPEMKKMHYQARLLMSKYLNRKLMFWEDIHHKDGNVFNNSIDNLEVLTRKEHFKHHADTIFGGMEGRSYGNSSRCVISDDPNLSWCHRCKQFLPRASFHLSSCSWNGLRSICKECKRKQYDKKHRHECYIQSKIKNDLRIN